ncbi:MAG: hypothetical protein L3J30_12705 [Marinosulfonomonas sp.]|nr:hypothetical protein [Marinosulfonomonas sp.]
MSAKEPETKKLSFATLVFYTAPRAIRRWLASRRTESNLLTRKVGFREVLTAILLMIPSSATMMLTYYGVSGPLAEQGGGIVQQGQALAFAMTIGIFSWLGWFYLFGLLYRLHGKRLFTSLAAGTFFIFSIAAIDAPFNMLALGGGSAVQMTIADTADSYEARKNAVFQQSTVTRQMLPAIEAQAVRFRALEADEIAHGVFSGSRGAGKVSAGFGQIATLLETLAGALNSGLDESQSIQDEIARIFSLIKADTYNTGPLRPRVRRVSIAADRLDDQLSRLNQYDYRVSIEATLTSLNAIFPAPKNAGSGFEVIQNEQLAVIAEMAKPVAESLQNALNQLASDTEISSERVRPQNATIAIRSKWRELIFQWMAAIFIDLAPGALLIILIAAFREIDAQKRNTNSTKNTPQNTPQNKEEQP